MTKSKTNNVYSTVVKLYNNNELKNVIVNNEHKFANIHDWILDNPILLKEDKYKYHVSLIHNRYDCEGEEIGDVYIQKEFIFYGNNIFDLNVI